LEENKFVDTGSVKAKLKAQIPGCKFFI